MAGKCGSVAVPEESATRQRPTSNFGYPSTPGIIDPRKGTVVGLFRKLQQSVYGRNDRQMEVVRAMSAWALERGKSIANDEGRQAAVEAAARDLLATFGRPSVQLIEAAVWGNPDHRTGGYDWNATAILNRAADLSK